MVPSAVKKTIVASGIGGAVAAAAWSLYDWRAALTFALAVVWSMVNVAVWTRLVQCVLVPGARRRLAVLGWVAAKIGLLGGGFGAVWAAAPLSLGQTIGLTIGVFSVLLAATVLAFAGAFLESAEESRAARRTERGASGAGLTVLVAISAMVLSVAARPSASWANAPAIVAGAQPATSSQAATHSPSAHAPSGDLAAHDALAHTEAHEESGHGEESVKPELPNLITVALQMRIGDKRLADTPVGHFLHTYEYQIFLLAITAFLCGVMVVTAGLRALVPGPTQALLEIVVEGFLNFFTGVLGSRERARRHLPFFGSIFLFIWFNNMFGIVPLFTGATSTFQLTASLAVLVFFYVHFHAIREAGFKHWLMHLLQDPKDAMGWALAPVFFVLHIIGELAKPLSLSLRLFGNITGEHILSGVFLILGLLLMSAIWPEPWIGVPLHLPFLFLSLLVGTIQATVFTLLSAIYLALFLPHEEEHGGHGHEGSHAA